MGDASCLTCKIIIIIKAKQHQQIVKSQLERETKIKTGFPVNRKGYFTSRRDLFNYNPNIRPKNLSVYKAAYYKYKDWSDTYSKGYM